MTPWRLLVCAVAGTAAHAVASATNALGRALLGEAHVEIDSRSGVTYMTDCHRCTGRGYHHGFGEDGMDPDWCSECGGPGEVAESRTIGEAWGELTGGVR
jgi:DnaJ-class molecular chaperone